ncbi:MAG: hypothetical protein UR26_C0001G0210 [candidate division TM6 bacterium GW2011_GWF2_32_72]|nr:MAG: hypothetical protein UR26_C0001G0210 [candidate division TM6 bacterium GW2011_GWF2_32_72]
MFTYSDLLAVSSVVTSSVDPQHEQHEQHSLVVSSVATDWVSSLQIIMDEANIRDRVSTLIVFFMSNSFEL